MGFAHIQRWAKTGPPEKQHAPSLVWSLSKRAYLADMTWEPMMVASIFKALTQEKFPHFRGREKPKGGK